MTTPFGHQNVPPQNLHLVTDRNVNCLLSQHVLLLQMPQDLWNAHAKAFALGFAFAFALEAAALPFGKALGFGAAFSIAVVATSKASDHGTPWAHEIDAAS